MSVIFCSIAPHDQKNALSSEVVKRQLVFRVKVAANFRWWSFKRGNVSFGNKSKKNCHAKKSGGDEDGEIGDKLI